MANNKDNNRKVVLKQPLESKQGISDLSNETINEKLEKNRILNSKSKPADAQRRGALTAPTKKGVIGDEEAQRELSEQEKNNEEMLEYLMTTFLGKILYEQDKEGNYINGYYEIEERTLERTFIPKKDAKTFKENETITDVSFDGYNVYVQDNDVGRYRLNDPKKDIRIRMGLPPLRVSPKDVEVLGKGIAMRMGRAWNPSAPIMDVELGHLRTNFMEGTVAPYGVTMAVRVSRATLALKDIRTAANQELADLLAVFMRCGVNLLISGPTGTGKETKNTDPIRTLKGLKTVGDIKVGDMIFDRQGKPTMVTNVFPHKDKKVYRVTFKDGRYVDCGAEHNWSVITNKRLKTARQEYRKLFKGRESEMTETNWEAYLMSESNWTVRTTEELIEDYVRTTKTKTGTNRSHFKYRVPQNGAVQYLEQELKTHPYVMGALLGDGCLNTPVLELSSADEWLVNKVAGLIGSPEVVKNKSNYSWNFRLPEGFDLQKEGYSPNTKNFQTKMVVQEELVGLCQTRFIPREYLESSIEQRYQLLQGLMDTDGSIRNDAGKRFNMSYTTTSERLRDDVAELIRSLGYQVTVSGKKRKGRNTEEYTITILTSNKNKEKFFSLPRKLDIAEIAKKHSEQRNEDVLAHNGNEDNFAKKYNTTYYDTLPITKIEVLDEVADMTCFTVDNSENLYQVGDFVVTHNTEMQKNLIQFIPDDQKISLMEDTLDSHIKLIYKNKDINSWATVKRGSGSVLPEITFQDLIKSGLRNNPDWLMVSEVRGAEAEALLSAALTSHSIMTTLHASGAENIPARITDMVAQAKAMDYGALQRNIVSVLNIGIQLERLVKDGKTVRRIKEMYEYVNYDPELGIIGYPVYEVNEVYDPETGTYNTVTNMNRLSDKMLKKIEDLRELQYVPSVFKDGPYRGKTVDDKKRAIDNSLE